MLCFFVVTKLLMLKLLLASISGLRAYDFGYHPSAEEFDNFVRDTKRTWTRDLLANEHRRAWTAKPPYRNVNGNFVPKYNRDEERLSVATKHGASWPGHVQRVGRPLKHWHESPSVAAAAHALNGQTVGSTFDFNMFDDQAGSGEINTFDLPSVPAFTSATQYNAHASSTTQPQLPAHSLKMPPVKQSLGSVIEIASSSETQKQTQQNSNQSFENLNKNHSAQQFPLFFTNPTTGIIYAITEVGHMPDTVNTLPSSSNNSIPIYISKEQYERDLYLQRKYYESNCQAPAPAPLDKISVDRVPTTITSAISAGSNSTMRPQIIRLQRPLSTPTTKIPISKLPTHLHKPPPVMVQTELTISDQVHLPTRKHKTKLKRKNKKKPNRPGRKPNTHLTGLKQSELPQIIKGVRASTAKPQTSTEKQQVATQLEKPNFTNGIFSKSLTSQEHRLHKRSVTNIRAYINEPRSMKMTDQQLIGQPALTPTKESNNVKTINKPKKTAVRRRPRIKQRRAKVGNHTEIQKLSNSAFNRTNWELSKQPARRGNSTKLKTKQTTKISNQTLSHNNTTELPTLTLSTTTHSNARKKKVKHRRKKNKDKVEKRGEFDLFDFDSDEDDEDDDDDNDGEKTSHRTDGDDEDDEEDDSYEEDEESFYDYKQTNKKRKRGNHKPHKENSNSASLEQTEEYTEETAEQTTDVNKNSIVIDDGSSAEPGADFGAMGSEETVIYSSPITTTTKPSTYTKSATKKRIRRRPSYSDASTSYEDYEDEDEAGVGGGIGGFFRMIFYPVQIFMNGVADNFGSKESEEEQYLYPTYTTYHNGIQRIESDEEEEEETNSLTSWLSSWFSFSRHKKNIGSTTPVPPPPTPTEPPSWFESWFNFGSKPTSEETSENDDKWFFGWFDSRPKRRRKKTTTTTTTVRTPDAQVPILTIVDPLKNPQNWIGILAHHIINSTATAVTQNPIMNAITQTTVNPDVPRKINYERYQIWRLKPLDDTQVQALEEYKKSEDGIKLQWLKGPSLRGLTDVLVPPKQLMEFEASLSFESIAHEVLIYDVGKAIVYEQAQEQFHFNAAMRPFKNNKNQQKQQAMTMSWHKYYEYDDIITHLEMLRMRHPQLVELIHIGRSYEGRPLVIVKIESKEHADSVASQSEVAHKKLKNKKQPKEANSVFIESGTHGLEWIGPATSLWMISELLRLIKSNKTTVDNEYIKNTTWYFIPILNPDGYVYSHKYDRFWRKTRSRHISRRNGIIDSAMTWLQQKKIATRVCYGVDLDRNWHYQWGKRGSSKSACNEVYAGPGPFSEPESKALSEFLIDYRKQIKMYISLQAYGQIISYPMKANTSFNAERIDDFLDVAMVGTDGLRKQGSKSRYKIDSTSDLVENRSGCSDAFAAYEVGIPFSFTIQLADNGVHGYLLPSASIEPTARDAFEIITAMIDYI
ncbi:uncharacterized protein LOC126758460 [Bactrocera neohumeralis]|uniref:uncharacterized protein LOC126758460 n=1 Tax=Bactrocera neohumeralis TaxID=98809 RepID=UPI0021655862|nr:uncharacterized protein LOC126758460 [Bactrocera neohumeralis]